MKNISLNLPPFRKGPFLCSSITRKIYIYLEPWNLVENCPINSTFWYISPPLIHLTNVIFIILNVREGYLYPKNPKFLAICCSLNFMQEAWKATTKLHIYDFIRYISNALLTLWSKFDKSGRFYEEIDQNNNIRFAKGRFRVHP